MKKVNKTRWTFALPSNLELLLPWFHKHSTNCLSRLIGRFNTMTANFFAFLILSQNRKFPGTQLNFSDMFHELKLTEFCFSLGWLRSAMRLNTKTKLRCDLTRFRSHRTLGFHLLSFVFICFVWDVFKNNHAPRSHKATSDPEAQPLQLTRSEWLLGNSRKAHAVQFTRYFRKFYLCSDWGKIKVNYWDDSSACNFQNFATEAHRMKRSPSDLLITRWASRYGHNVTELFKLLSLMPHYQAMTEIKELVDERYYVWFQPVQSPHSLMIGDEKKMNEPSQIFNAKKPKPSNDVPKENLNETLNELLNIPKIPLEKLAEATDNWSAEHELGKGGFGVVYRGEWLATKVAIKKLEYRGSRSGGSSKEYLMQSLNEMRHLNNCRHDNIVPIYGYALKDEICVVVYQLMTGGSLEERLKRKGYESLTWPQRWNIAKGTAKGLQYLHRYNEKPLIHSDIKPANILLDSCCEPKIGDFGLSRVGHLQDACQELSQVFGTKPYVPHELRKHKLFSTKVDVFSFGVVLFEIATGFKSYDQARKDHYLYDHMARVDQTSFEQIRQIIDPSTPNDEACFNLCSLMVFLGKRCTDHNPNQRPEMIGVFKTLENFKPVVSIPNIGMWVFAHRLQRTA